MFVYAATSHHVWPGTICVSFIVAHTHTMPGHANHKIQSKYFYTEWMEVSDTFTTETHTIHDQRSRSPRPIVRNTWGKHTYTHTHVASAQAIQYYNKIECLCDGMLVSVCSRGLVVGSGDRRLCQLLRTHIQNTQNKNYKKKYKMNYKKKFKYNSEYLTVFSRMHNFWWVCGSRVKQVGRTKQNRIGRGLL